MLMPVIPRRLLPAEGSAIAGLLAEPARYGFMQAVRLLERWHLQRDGLSPQDVMARRLRFRNSLSLAFPPSEVAEFRAVEVRVPGTAGTAADEAFQRYEIVPAFMGLLGAGGTLPTFYTELFAQRELMQRDGSARRFLDIFVHRSVVLFYQAWRKHRLALRQEADPRQGGLPQVLALAGLGQPALRGRLQPGRGGVADDALAFYAGLLQQRPVSVAAIGQILAHFFALPVRVEQFVGRWFSLPPAQHSLLGVAQAGLGGQAVLGERIWQRDLRLRLHLGPMGREQFRRFLPSGSESPDEGPGLLALRELLRLLTGHAFEYEVRLSLLATDVRPAVLTPADAPRLGWDGFLITRPATEHRSDAGYDLHALA